MTENYKYVVLLGDGMADEPLAELDGRTPLQAASTPNFDRLAEVSELGTAVTVPEGFPAGSDVANLSVFGYAPADYYTGRAPLEAASMGLELGPDDVVFRCNLVNILHYQARGFMHDFSAGHISTADAHEIIAALNRELKTPQIEFFPGVSYRHLLLIRNCPPELARVSLAPPHDIIGQEVVDHLPADYGSLLLNLMTSSQMIIHGLPKFRERLDRGEETANSIWLWGQGKRPRLDSFKELYGVSGAVISAVDLIKGIGLLAGMEVIEVPGATGYLDTNYENKAAFALRALAGHDFVYLHVESPDESSHEGSLEKKLQAIGDLDQRLLGPLLEGLARKFPGHRILVLPDHPTPIRLKTHTAAPVPFMLYDSLRPVAGSEAGYNEITAAAAANHFAEGWRLQKHFIGKAVSCNEKL
ncbi:MAG TPA: cofactor-independent phosphoglycerate mutase [Proteobacteria bacterium]|nr:cofactor-independent phosphoglycerate mutase [Pseudomonadota bacterium]